VDSKNGPAQQLQRHQHFDRLIPAAEMGNISGQYHGIEIRQKRPQKGDLFIPPVNIGQHQQLGCRRIHIFDRLYSTDCLCQIQRRL
jgi:hypothetical protein